MKRYIRSSEGDPYFIEKTRGGGVGKLEHMNRNYKRIVKKVAPSLQASTDANKNLPSILPKNLNLTKYYNSYITKGVDIDKAIEVLLENGWRADRWTHTGEEILHKDGITIKISNGASPKYAYINLIQTNESSVKASVDLSDYTQMSYTLKDNGKTYALYRKIENGKGKWAAAPYTAVGEPATDEAFEITYDQARGFEPLSNTGKLGKEIGKKVLPSSAKVNSSRSASEPDNTGREEGRLRYLNQFHNWNDVYKEFAKIADKYFPDDEKICDEVEKFYAKYKGDPNFDTAYERWHETDEIEDYDELFDEDIESATSTGVLPFVVNYMYDDGDAENGTRPYGGEDLVYAKNADEACKRWEEYCDVDFQYGYLGCEARLATDDDIERINADKESYGIIPPEE